MARIDVRSKTGPFIPQGNRFRLALPILPREQNLGSSPHECGERWLGAAETERGIAVTVAKFSTTHSPYEAPSPTASRPPLPRSSGARNPSS